MENFTYNEMTSRNISFISNELQQKLKTTKLIFAGCGLSSVMAEMAIRIGFEKIALIDADHVEISNINRQCYNLIDIGLPKVSALKQKLLTINPNLDISTNTNGITSKNDIDNILCSGDIIINTIDFGELYFELVHTGMEQNKLVLCPFNPGFGGLVVCFSNKSGNLYDLLGTDKVEHGAEFSKKLIRNNPEIKIEQQMRDNLDTIFEQISQSGFEPQISIGVNMSSAITLSCIIKYINGEKIPYCPSLIFRGLYHL